MPNCPQCISKLTKRIDPDDGSKYYNCKKHGYIRATLSPKPKKES